MAYVKGLRCRECDAEYEAGPFHVCELCFGPLEVNYDYDAIRKETSREEIASGPASLWRYRKLLPVSHEEPIDIGSGFTPLIKARNLGRALGIPELYIKNDAVNPTYSFKDRVVTVAVTKALEFGFDTVACASTGNLANSVAAHAARANLRCFIFVPAGLEQGKVVGTAVYGPHLVEVNGSYDEVNRLSSELADKYGWAFVNINLRPFYSEGSKTLAYETAEQLGWVAPDHVVVPVAGGSVLTKIWKGFRELHELGLIPGLNTRVSAAQAEGCAPVVHAFRNGLETFRPVKPNTIAKSLAIGNPADGFYALQTVRVTGGYAEAVADEEIVEAVELLARTEGIFTETAGGVTVGVLKKLAQSGRIRGDERVVIYITGNGLKTLEAVSGKVVRRSVIEPTVGSFEQLFADVMKNIA